MTNDFRCQYEMVRLRRTGPLSRRTGKFSHPTPVGKLLSAAHLKQLVNVEFANVEFGKLLGICLALENVQQLSKMLIALHHS